jgi:hypothetical protein
MRSVTIINYISDKVCTQTHQANYAQLKTLVSLI